MTKLTHALAPDPLSRRAFLLAAAGCALRLPAAAHASDASQNAASEAPLSVAALKGPTAMGLVKLMDDVDAGRAPHAYDVAVMAAADEVTPLLVKGELDCACVPANLAAVLYNKTEGAVRVLAVNTLGVLYVVETGDGVHGVEDLPGRTVFASGRGSTPEYALNYLLRAHGLEPGDDVDVEWKSEHTECLASLLTAGDGAVALLPQPFVAAAQLKDPSVRVALDLTQEWDSCQQGQEEPSRLITGVVVARAEVVEERAADVDAFMDDYAASVAYVRSDVDGAAALVGAYGIVDEDVARAALPLCNITFVAGGAMRDALAGYLDVLYKSDAASVGGEPPADDFYYRGDEDLFYPGCADDEPASADADA